MGNIIVTGGAGFLGSHLIDHLMSEGHQVYALDDLSSGCEKNLSKWLKLPDDELKSMGDIFQYTPGKRPRLKLLDIDITNKYVDNPWLSDVGDVDCIFHLAGRMDVMSSFREPYDDGMRNYIGTVNVLEFARKMDCPRVIQRSSFTVYSRDNPVVVNEEGEIGPISPYAHHKYMSERILDLYNEHYGMMNVSLRLFNMYGPRQDPSSIYSGVVTRFLDRALRDKKLHVYGKGSQKRDFIHAKDAIKAIHLANTQKASGVYNVGTGIGTSITDLAMIIKELLGDELEIEKKPERKGELKNCIADISRIRGELGFEPEIDLKSGIRNTLEWMRIEGERNYD